MHAIEVGEKPVIDQAGAPQEPIRLCSDACVWDLTLRDYQLTQKEAAVLLFDRHFVRDWSERYPVSDREQRLFARVGPAAASRGYLTSQELAEIGRWKSRRATGYLAQNDQTLVEDVTRVAFAPDTPDRLRHRILCLLRGIGQPIASAILTVWKPGEHTVLDYRVVEALQQLAKRGILGSDLPGGEPGALPDYWAYLQVYRPVADRLGVSYRKLDRALWKWNEAGMPERWKQT